MYDFHEWKNYATVNILFSSITSIFEILEAHSANFCNNIFNDFQVHCLLWLVVPWCHHVWNVDRLPTFLFRKSDRNLQKDHAMERYINISPGSTHFGERQSHHFEVLQRCRQKSSNLGRNQSFRIFQSSSGCGLGTYPGKAIGDSGRSQVNR